MVFYVYAKICNGLMIGSWSDSIPRRFYLEAWVSNAWFGLGLLMCILGIFLLENPACERQFICFTKFHTVALVMLMLNFCDDFGFLLVPALAHINRDGPQQKCLSQNAHYISLL
jgi:hypothetical protein